MPNVEHELVDALASCKNSRCVGYKQQPVKAIRTTAEYTYIDLGGDLPGVERSTIMFGFADLADAQCEHCGEPRLVSDQTRPIYPNISGQPQDALLAIGQDSERVRDLELANAKHEAEMAQMQVAMERMIIANERLMAQLEEPARRGPGRPRKETAGE